MGIVGVTGHEERDLGAPHATPFHVRYVCAMASSAHEVDMLMPMTYSDGRTSVMSPSHTVRCTASAEWSPEPWPREGLVDATENTVLSTVTFTVTA